MNVLSWILWVWLALPVAYMLVFAIAARLEKSSGNGAGAGKSSFIVLIPAYKSDAFIAQTAAAALEQNYPSDRFRVLVISDSMSPETVLKLRETGAEVLEVSFENSTKAKSLQSAMEFLGPQAADYVVILDSDNIVDSGFLGALDGAFQSGAKAVQAHRTAKNTDTPVAMLDAATEEINNSIFRKGHCALGLSSALIGSGMAFPYGWFSRALPCSSPRAKTRRWNSGSFPTASRWNIWTK